MIALALALTLVAQAGLAEACAPFTFRGVTASARIRDTQGRWHAAAVEGDGTRIRIEYAAPSTPWGRVAMVSDFHAGPAFVFPVASPGPIPRAARVTWKTSLGEALPMFRLTTDFIGQFPDESKTPERFNGLPCYLALNRGASLNSMCIHDSGLPLYVRDDKGRAIFEVTRLTESPVPGYRFQPPRGLPVTDKRPGYLEKLSCSGWGARQPD